MIPPALLDCLELADPSWRPVLQNGLSRVAAADPDYLPILAKSAYLPTQGRLFAAFQQPLDAVRYVLVGEGPYPREESASGVCFMDGAVKELWSGKGLSKAVNRATSLRNFIKMLLVCEGTVRTDSCSGEAFALACAPTRAAGSGYIQDLLQLQDALHAHGFLLLNAALVYRPDVAPVKEGRAWRPFFQAVLDALASRPALPPPTLILWGKVAELVASLAGADSFPRLVSEHPYNLSFIGNREMQAFFSPLRLLRC